MFELPINKYIYFTDYFFFHRISPILILSTSTKFTILNWIYLFISFSISTITIYLTIRRPVSVHSWKNVNQTPSLLRKGSTHTTCHLRTQNISASNSKLPNVAPTDLSLERLVSIFFFYIIYNSFIPSQTEIVFVFYEPRSFFFFWMGPSNWKFLPRRILLCNLVKCWIHVSCLLWQFWLI